jgi:hypothetical protein
MPNLLRGVPPFLPTASSKKPDDENFHDRVQKNDNEQYPDDDPKTALRKHVGDGNFKDISRRELINVTLLRLARRFEILVASSHHQKPWPPNPRLILLFQIHLHKAQHASQQTTHQLLEMDDSTRPAETMDGRSSF